MRRWFGAIIVIALASGLWIGASSSRIKNWLDTFREPVLPPAENVQQATNTVITNSTNTVYATAELPAEKNLAIPFTSQAPDANWDADHEEFCEEAAMLMVSRYFAGRVFSGTTDQEQGLQELKRWELDHLGWYFDTTAAENARILRELYGLRVQLVEHPTIPQIKAAIAAGHPVIIPSAGRELGNPNFTAPGPIYHNLVIRGYTRDNKFITNDPGTRKGEAYVYDESVIMNAIHDWVPAGDRTVAAHGDVAQGRPVILIVSSG